MNNFRQKYNLIYPLPGFSSARVWGDSLGEKPETERLRERESDLARDFSSHAAAETARRACECLCFVEEQIFAPVNGGVVGPDSGTYARP